jgi:hypothetical protein
MQEIINVVRSYLLSFMHCINFSLIVYIPTTKCNNSHPFQIVCHFWVRNEINFFSSDFTAFKFMLEWSGIKNYSDFDFDLNLKSSFFRLNPKSLFFSTTDWQKSACRQMSRSENKSEANHGLLVWIRISEIVFF